MWPSPDTHTRTVGRSTRCELARSPSTRARTRCGSPTAAYAPRALQPTTTHPLRQRPAVPTARCAHHPLRPSPAAPITRCAKRALRQARAARCSLTRFRLPRVAVRFGARARRRQHRHVRRPAADHAALGMARPPVGRDASGAHPAVHGGGRRRRARRAAHAALHAERHVLARGERRDAELPGASPRLDHARPAHACAECMYGVHLHVRRLSRVWRAHGACVQVLSCLDNVVTECRFWKYEDGAFTLERQLKGEVGISPSFSAVEPQARARHARTCAPCVHTHGVRPADPRTPPSSRRPPTRSG